MVRFPALPVILGLVPALLRAEPDFPRAEVRLPYQELKSLIDEASESRGKPGLESALLSARFRLEIEDGQPVIHAVLRTASFVDARSVVPMVGGGFTLERVEPESARIIVEDGMLSHVMEARGDQTLEMRLIPESGSTFDLVMPVCATVVFETGGLGEDRAVSITVNGRERLLGAEGKLPLPLAGGSFPVRLLGDEETREALRPPEPSVWSWQHQVLVTPEDEGVAYHVIARASAAGGSGVSAELPLPPEARSVTASGEDLVKYSPARGEDRQPVLRLEWGTRDRLEREVEIFYQLPRRPLDGGWDLQAPAFAAEDTRSRFIIPVLSDMEFSAEGMAGPFAASGLPKPFQRKLAGGHCFHLEAGGSAAIGVKSMPVVPTADAVIHKADWSLKIEPDGAMLAEGTMTVEYDGSQTLLLDTPPGMTLLSCQVQGKATPPVDRGGGKLEIPLPVGKGAGSVKCSFTGKSEGLDPMEGTLALVLPRTPVFIRELNWRIELPAGYEAETHGNLRRTENPNRATPATVNLRKNLCRDERPEVRVFYRRSDLKF